MKYTRELLQSAVNDSTSIAGVLRYFNIKQAGGTQSHIKDRINYFNIDISHFVGKGHMKGKVAPNRKTAKEILIQLPIGSIRLKTPQLKRAMLEVGIVYECEICKNVGQ